MRTLLLGVVILTSLWGCVTSTRNATCARGVPIVLCLADPCTGRSCPAFPLATCESNFCGGCNYGFFLRDDTNVTDRCTNSERVCPLTETTSDGGGIGICVSMCDLTLADSCPTGQFCCRNGCGTVCRAPINVTVCRDRYNRTHNVGETFMDACNTCFCSDTGSIACTKVACISNTRCPATSGSEIGACVRRCETNASCSNGQLCCGSCPRQCVEPEFVCNVSGTVYQVNQTFSAADGCNTCTCTSSGQVRCTRVACIDPCYDEPDTDPGDCPLPPLRYYYDARMGVCRNYTRGCDADSTNDFSSAGECFKRCKPSSVCNGAVYPGGTRPPCDLVGRRYTFFGYQGACINISYALCGEDYEDYNVFRSYRECYQTCIGPDVTTPPTTECSAGLVRCFVNPCTVNTCPNFPRATCNASYCGRCAAHFFLSGRNVTDACEDAPSTCPDGSPIVRCASDPCSSAACPTQPGARCVPDYCGRCGYKYLDSTGADITRQCNATLPVPIRQPICPNINATLFSICANNCTGQRSCGDRELCCPTSCGGRVCTASSYVPYYPVPRICPAPTLRTSLAGNCTAIRNCRNNSDCGFEQACCTSECGKVCKANANEYPCSSVLREIRETGIRKPPGYYTPTCDDSGMFNATQCTTDDTCWCVDVNTGTPVSSFYPRGVNPECQTCGYNNRRYGVGDTFPSTDGCNKCSCTSTGVLCTLRACVDTCSLPPVPGMCRGSFPAYFYNSTSQRCERFTYGGCGGNGNRFLTINDCLGQCNRTSVCLLNAARGPCQALSYLFFFNRTSDRCESFQYGGCQGNRNSFPSGRECAATCSPDVPVPSCATVRCALPVCEGNSDLIRDDTRCCPYCRPRGCNSDRQFTCSSGTCISRDRRCDRIRDCRDGSDEMNCEEECEFRCGSGECIRRSQVCDEILDCKDGSDVTNCTSTFTGGVYITPDIATQCPAIEDSFCSRSMNCSTNRGCMNGTVCCENQCNQRSCMRGVPLNCQGIRFQQEQRGLLGAFVPTCQDDGSFNVTQCRERYCWCANVVTGQPISDAVQGPAMPNCGGTATQCVGSNNERLRVGESQSTEDGCNRCACTAEGLRCSRRRCETASCRFEGQDIKSGSNYSDDCNTCKCAGGLLSCQRKNCTAITQAQEMKKRVRVTMPFKGDYDSITDKDEFKREVIRTCVVDYTTIGINQDQMSIEVKPGSIIVIITIAESNSTTDSANTTVFVAQLEQDFNSGVLVFRYDGLVLVPSGEFQSETLEQDDDDISGFKTWHIAVIVVGAVLLLAIGIIIAVAITVCVMKRSNGDEKSRYMTDNGKDYELKKPLDS